MANSIIITGNFDGGNPKDPNSIIQTGPDAFTIIPYSEDGDPNYKFRLDVKIENNTEKTRKLHLSVEWQEPQFNHLRNYIYGKSKDEIDWTRFPMTVEDTGTRGDIGVKPGTTHLCMHPKYNYRDYIDFIHSTPDDEKIQKIKIGETPEKREIYMLKISAGNRNPQKTILIVARVHPYETAGSYCMEGILHHLQFTFPLSHFTIYLIPMANPDGVYNGLCKLTATDGIDISKLISDTDSTSLLIKCAIDKINPHIYCELHNWMLHEYDGIYFLNWHQAKRFVRNLHSKNTFNKKWKIHLRKKVLSMEPLGFKKYCRDNFGTTCLCVEYPWYNRDITDMKLMGADSLMALTKL